MVRTKAMEVADWAEQWVNGQETELAALQGRPVLLYFWHPRDPKSLPSLPRVQELTAAFAERGLATIGLCVLDDPADVQPLIRRHQLTFPIVLDSDADLHQRWFRVHEPGTPYCYLLDGKGIIAWEGRPDQLTPGRIEPLLPTTR